MTTRIDVPDPARWVVETLEAAGFETWTVGGAVRDALLGHPSADWDFATAARPRDVQRVFRRTVPVGIDHGTVGVLDRHETLHEVTTFRRDVDTDGRHAVVTFADTILEDLSRRDFTINAIAWHPTRAELFDPFDGQVDLDQRRLRTVGSPEERFAEDYLRILRALRFAGRLGLSVDSETWDALVAAMDGLGGLSAERIREEWMKVMSGTDPAASLDLYRRSGALARVAPALATASDAAWKDALRRVQALPATEPILRSVAVFETVGCDTGAGQRVGVHPRRALAEGVGAWMQGLRFSNAETDRAVHLLATHADPPAADASAADLRRWLATVGPERAPDRFALIEAGVRATTDLIETDTPDRLARLRDELASDPALSVGDLAIGGRDLIALGMKPGPHFGDLLDALLDLVLEDPALNTRDALLAEVERRADP